MKRVTALAAAISACLLTGSMAAAQEIPPAPQPVPRQETQPTTGQGPTIDEPVRTRTADASGMRPSQMDSAEFAKKAGAAGAAEVAIGKLGAQRATSPEVKAFAQKMVTDHTKANKELMAAARMKNLEVPTEPGLMHKGVLEKLERQKADADFDHDFMQEMVRDHEAAVELFQNASTDSNVAPELRSFAKKILPMLDQHMKAAKAIESELAKRWK